MANEKRLIDANELVRNANKLDVLYFTGETDIQIHDCQMVELGAVLAEIDEAPTVDAVEVMHGRWIDYGAGACCSNCGASLLHQDESNNWGIEPSGFLYCPYCGAKMDGDGNGS